MIARGSLIAGLGIFVVSVFVRGFMQMYGGPEIGDISWITTFGVVAATWLGLGGQLAETRSKLGEAASTLNTVQKQTNGMLEKKMDDTAHMAAEAAVHKVLARGDETR